MSSWAGYARYAWSPDHYFHLSAWSNSTSLETRTHRPLPCPEKSRWPQNSCWLPPSSPSHIALLFPLITFFSLDDWLNHVWRKRIDIFWLFSWFQYSTPDYHRGQEYWEDRKECILCRAVTRFSLLDSSSFGYDVPPNGGKRIPYILQYLWDVGSISTRHR